MFISFTFEEVLVHQHVFSGLREFKSLCYKKISNHLKQVVSIGYAYAIILLSNIPDLTTLTSLTKKNIKLSQDKFVFLNYT